MEFSDFSPGLALHAQQCGMMVEVHDNMRPSLDICRTNGQLLNIFRSTKYQSNLKIRSVKKTVYISLFNVQLFSFQEEI